MVLFTFTSWNDNTQLSASGYIRGRPPACAISQDGDAKLQIKFAWPYYNTTGALWGFCLHFFTYELVESYFWQLHINLVMGDNLLHYFCEPTLNKSKFRCNYVIVIKNKKMLKVLGMAKKSRHKNHSSNIKFMP